MKEATWVIHEITEETLHILHDVTAAAKQERRALYLANVKLSFRLRVKAARSPEPNIKASAIRINFDSHNNPRVIGDNADWTADFEDRWRMSPGWGQFNLSVEPLAPDCQSFVTDRRESHNTRSQLSVLKIMSKSELTPCVRVQRKKA